MPKKKKKKGADKEKKARRKSGVNERDIVFYEQQIGDNNRQLTRLRERNDFLEAEVETLKGKLSQLEEDCEDVIAHLKRILEQKTEESRELNERLIALEQLRKDEYLAFKLKEDNLQQNYHNMETNLNAEIKLVSGKLNSLEEWKNARAELTKKFEIQEKKIAEQEERHKQELYEAEKSLVIGKAKMQKDVQKHLNELALKFEEATNMRIADATHRAIRENISLHLELDSVIKTCQKLEDKMKVYKEKKEYAQLYKSLYEDEIKIVFEKLSEQNRLLNILSQDYIKFCNQNNQDKIIATQASIKEEIVQNCKDQLVVLEQKSKLLEESIENSDNHSMQIIDNIQDDKKQMRRLDNILDNVKRLISDFSSKLKLNDFKETHSGEFYTKLNEICELINSSDKELPKNYE